MDKQSAMQRKRRHLIWALIFGALSGLTFLFGGIMWFIMNLTNYQGPWYIERSALEDRFTDAISGNPMTTLMGMAVLVTYMVVVSRKQNEDEAGLAKKILRKILFVVLLGIDAYLIYASYTEIHLFVEYLHHLHGTANLL